MTPLTPQSSPPTQTGEEEEKSDSKIAFFDLLCLFVSTTKLNRYKLDADTKIAWNSVTR